MSENINIDNGADETEVKTASMMKLYFKLQEEYSKKYGEKTVLFMQVGAFYESYATNKSSFDIGQLTGIINATLTRKNKKKKEEPSISNPYLLGFPTASLQKNLKLLIKKGYTVVLYDQVQKIVSREISDKKTGEITLKENIQTDRVFAGVFTIGTYINENNTYDNSYLMCIYIAEETQLRGLPIYAYGLTMVDMITGKTFIHQFYGKQNDERFGTDEINRLIAGYNPKKIIYYIHTVSHPEKYTEKFNSFKEYVNFNETTDNFYFYFDSVGSDSIELLTKHTFDNTIQNEYLSKIFGIDKKKLVNEMSVIEILDLEKHPYGLISLMIMLQFVSKHNVVLIDNIIKPYIYEFTEHLILGNNAIGQLNVIDSGNLEIINSKYTSLFDVVNKTKTLMGRRLLKESLLNPLSQKNKSSIKKRYDMISELIKYENLSDLVKKMAKISDVERLHRKMATNKMSPYDLVQLDTCYKSISDVISTIRESKLLIADLIDEKHLKNFISIQFQYDKIFDFDIMKSYTNFNDIQQNIFKDGINNKLSDMIGNIDYAKNIITATGDYFYSLIKKDVVLKRGESEIFELCNNKADGWFLKINNSRGKLLMDKLSKVSNLIKIRDSNGDKIILDKSTIKFKNLSSKTNIIIESLKNHSDDIVVNKFKLNELTKIEFYKQLTKLYEKYHISLYSVSEYIANIDFLISGALVAEEYSYCRPKINNSDKSNKSSPSYLIAKSLRHPIIERLCKDTEYIPNDISLGNVPGKFSDNGILLYGLNSSGKSALMKSVGLAVILAQIGYFVPASEFIYEPYMSIFARINGNDNMFKGQSSFLLETFELDAIINRTDGSTESGSYSGVNTLVIGDEVCRGTESVSGIAIVAATLVHLSEANTSFIFSSHLHELNDIPEITNLSNLRIYHLHVEYDTKIDAFKYFRKLRHGSGPTVYGLMVAKTVIKNTNFINLAETIKKRLLGEHQKDLVSKKSNYNKKLVVRSCSICSYTPINTTDKELETHHIHFQENCSSDGKILEKPYLSKNEKYNLVVLCRKCHESVHRDEINIRGYINTSIGPILDYVQKFKSFDEILADSKIKRQIK